MTEEDFEPRAYSQTLNESIERMHRARSELNQARLTNGTVPLEAHVRFEETVLTLYYELRPYARQDNRTKSDWEENKLDQLPEICGRLDRSESVKTSGGMIRASSSVSVSHADVDNLLSVSETMDEISHELGFTAAVETETPTNEATMSDLRGLLTERGQYEALENLPEAPEGDE
ncbi:hypothetical protein EL22_25320 [Halostagnicola sp. A56]|uniref:hypothetical protein n=1 Tax=Halostagnicola sp. A56 TaxID=1495067 RepID=UPI00049FAA6F|nr:hypothetical protein [Halostagnicola sp. A56]KDE56693.1 hypothetical protein EL22_25320 [Halostagnicola sp. A56]